MTGVDVSQGPAGAVRPARDPAAAGGRGLLRSPFFWAAAVALVTVPVLRPFLRHVPAPPPVVGQLPEFRLVDQAGAAFGSKELRGQVWVADFFFTSCPSVCPKLTRAAKALQERFAAADVPVRLVSISVDPETDTPARLTDYAREYALDTTRWSLLTGDLADIRRLVVEGFAAHMGDKVPDGAGLMDIAHSTHLVLVDGQGRIRGYYGSDEQGSDEVFHRAQHVRWEQDGRE